MPSNELLTTADDALLIPCLSLTEEVDGRGPPHPRKRAYTRANVSSKVAFEKEDRNDDQTERVSARATSEEEYGGG